MVFSLLFSNLRLVFAQLCLLCMILQSTSAFSPVGRSNNFDLAVVVDPVTSVQCRLANTSRRSRYLQRHFSSPDGGGDDFMASLKNRMAEVNDRETKIPLVVLDAMLPRQTLKINVKNPLLKELVKNSIQNESPFFGMLGMARLVTGESVHLKRGVEVQIINPEFVDDDGVRLELRAGRRFEIMGEIDTVGMGWTEARVDFLDFQEEEDQEILGEERLAVARAISKATELTSPNMRTVDNLSLVEQWIELAKQNEREPGQIDRLLETLGELPPQETPSDLAFWVGALINPLPPMGVATEIRPALLSAKTAEDRVQIAKAGILKSIKHMDGTEPMW
jgi:Lon protease-like protein